MAVVIMPSRKAKSRGLVPVVMSSSVTPATLTLPSGVTNAEVEFVIIGVESQSVRWRGDGGTPVADSANGASACSGVLAAVGDVIVYTGDPSQFKAVNAGAATPTTILQAEFYSG